MGFHDVMQKGRKAAKKMAAGGVIALSSLLPMKEGRAQDYFKSNLRLPVGHVDTTFSLTRNEFTASVRIVADVDTSEAKAGLKVSRTEVSVPILHYWKAGWDDTATVSGLFGSMADSNTWRGAVRYFSADMLVAVAADTMARERRIVFVKGKKVSDVFLNDSSATKDSLSFGDYTATIRNFSKGHDNEKDLFYSMGELVISADYKPPLGLRILLPDTVWLAPMRQIGIAAGKVEPDVKIDMDVVESITVNISGAGKTTLPASMHVRASYGDSSLFQTMGITDLGLDRFIFAMDFICQIEPLNIGTPDITTRVWYKATGATNLGGGEVWPGDNSYHVARYAGINMFARPPPIGDGVSFIGLDLNSSIRQWYVFRRIDSTLTSDWMFFSADNPSGGLVLDDGKFRTYTHLYPSIDLRLEGKFTDRTDVNGFRMIWDTPIHGQITRGAKLKVNNSAKHYLTALPTHKKEIKNGVLEGQIPESALMNAHPNPTSGWVSLEFEQKRAGHATIHVRDALGRVVQTESSDWLVDGKQHVAFQLNSDLPSGSYTIETGGKAVREVLVR